MRFISASLYIKQQWINQEHYHVIEFVSNEGATDRNWGRTTTEWHVLTFVWKQREQKGTQEEKERKNREGERVRKTEMVWREGERDGGRERVREGERDSRASAFEGYNNYLPSKTMLSEPAKVTIRSPLPSPRQGGKEEGGMN